MDLKPAIDAFLRQSVDDRGDAHAADTALHEVVGATVSPGGGVIVDGSAFPDATPVADPQHAASPSAIPPLNLGV